MARHSLTFNGQLEELIDDWRRQQKPIPDFTESVDILVRLGLLDGRKKK